MAEDLSEGKRKNIVKSWGVLLWSVVRADGKINKEEVDRIRQQLEKLHLDPRETEEALAFTKKLEEERIDIYSFVRPLMRELNYREKVALVKELFAVAFSDKSLASEELEAIRTIANIFYISHKDFIQAKLEAQKEAGLRTFNF